MDGPRHQQPLHSKAQFKAKTAEAGKPIDGSLSIEGQVLLYLTAVMDIISCGISFACFIGVQEGEFIGVGFFCENIFPVTVRYTAINMQTFFPTQR